MKYLDNLKKITTGTEPTILWNNRHFVVFV